MEQLLHRYLNGTASPEEVKSLEADPEFMHYLKIAKATSEFSAPPVENEQSFERLESKLKRSRKVRTGRTRFLFTKIAAALVILIVGYYFFTSGTTTYVTDVAEKETIVLPDASEVTMNALSELSFKKKTWNEERTLSLKGEAFFKVDKGQKFSVQTPNGVVTVLGTQFNVFVRNNRLDIKCFEGLVSVSYGDTLMKVPAGTQIEIANRNNIQSSSIEAISPNWISNESTFENVSLSLVLEELQRQYPIQITAQNMVDKKFTGSFTHNNLDVALRSICDPLQVDFTIKGEEVTLHAKKNN